MSTRTEIDKQSILIDKLYTRSDALNAKIARCRAAMTKFRKQMARRSDQVHKYSLAAYLDVCEEYNEACSILEDIEDRLVRAKARYWAMKGTNARIKKFNAENSKVFELSMK